MSLYLGDKMFNYLKIMTSKQKFYLVIGFICMISLYAGLADYDWYWQCELGKAIITEGNFNGIYDLTWGSLGVSEYLDHEWLTNIMFYVVSLTGQYAISVAKALICVAYALSTCYFLESMNKKVNDVSMLAIGFYLFVMAAVFIKVKAYIISVVFLLLEVVFLRKYKESRETKYFIFMGILLLVWNNMHSGSIPLFFIVAGVFWLTELKRDKRVLMTLPAYLFGLVVNPYGPNLILFDIEHNFDPVMKELVLDWRCIDGKESLGQICTVIVLLVMFFLIGTKLKRHAFDLVMIGVVFVMSFQSARHLIYLAPFFYSIVLDNEYDLDIGETARTFASLFCVGIAVLSMMQAFGSTTYATSYAMDYMEPELVDAVVETNSETSDGFFGYGDQVWTLGLKSFVSGAFPCTRERTMDSYEMQNSASDARIAEIIEKYGLTKFLSVKYNQAASYLEGNGLLYDYLASHDEYELLYDSDYYFYFVRKDLL